MTPDNDLRRAQYASEHAVTNPELRALTDQRAAKAIDRAEELSNIAAVVTIRTRPKPKPSH